MLADLGTHLDGIFFCPHGPHAGCGCRKPAPGLLDDIARRFGRSIRGVPFIGDSWSDVEAARAAGARPILVATGKSDAARHLGADASAPAIHDDLASAATALIERY